MNISKYLGFALILAAGSGHVRAAAMSDADRQQPPNPAKQTDISDFGCNIDGTADATDCLQNAINSLHTGGRLHIRGKLLIGKANIIVPDSVGIAGDCAAPGGAGHRIASSYAGKMCGVIMLSPNRTILEGVSASIEGVIIYRAGMNFPADSRAFVGDAITIAGDDASVSNSMIMGFNRAIYSKGYGRVRLRDLDLDNQNGIEITGSYDVDYISSVHQWPFSTIDATGAALTLTRAGTAISLHDGADWAKITDCFSYGYFRGVSLKNVNSVTLIGVGSDNVTSPRFPGSIGLEVTGYSGDVRVIGYQAAGQDIAGIRIGITTGSAISLLAPTVWGGSAHGVLIDSGDVSIIGGIFGGLNGIVNGITVNNAISHVSITGVKFGDLTGTAINATAANNNIVATALDIGPSVANASTPNIGTPNILSASSLRVPSTGDIFTISGTTGIRTINVGWAGRTITLLFASRLTVYSGSGAGNAIRLSGGADFVTSAGGTLTLRSDGAQWREIGRSK